MSLLSIGKSGVLAAQVGLATTSHNISNANTAGYSRQVALQQTAVGQGYSYGYVGSGTQISAVQRVYDSYLATATNAAQATTSSLDTYATQIGQVDDLLSDTTAGLSPALQDFFASVQDIASTPATTASRQALLSSAQQLAARFQSMSARLTEIGDGVNTQISSNVDVINSYANQIAQLNQSIVSVSNGGTTPPNDLLDQRDSLVAELNKYVKATTVTDSNGMMTVSIGSGQPLVAAGKAFQLTATPAADDPTRLEIGYVTNNKVSILPENALTGGSLGGLLEFRTNALDVAQNSLGRIAVGLAYSFNAQHELGQDANGALGGQFFTVAPAVVSGDSHNNPLSTTKITGTISDPSALTTSDYNVAYDGSNYVVTRESDGKKTLINPYPQTVPQTIDGVDYAISGTAAAGDSYTVKPTSNGANGFSVAITDLSKIAVGTPILGSTPASNIGTGKISAGSVDQTYLQPGNALTAPVTLTYAKADPADPASVPTLSFSPATQDVTVVANGVSTTYPAGTAVPYTDGAKLSFGGVNVTVSGTPGDGDTFSVGPTTSTTGDNRNAALLGALQTSKILDGGKANFQDGYATAVSYIGNKDREAQVNGAASQALLTQNQTAQQSVSGVNLDEEAANLLRYQQAYQASGKVMQIASTLFDTLLTLGQ